jgi:hypothetical protein
VEVLEREIGLRIVDRKHVDVLREQLPDLLRDDAANPHVFDSTNGTPCFGVLIRLDFDALQPLQELVSVDVLDASLDPSIGRRRDLRNLSGDVANELVLSNSHGNLSLARGLARFGSELDLAVTRHFDVDIASGSKVQTLVISGGQSS